MIICFCTNLEKWFSIGTDGESPWLDILWKNPKEATKEESQGNDYALLVRSAARGLRLCERASYGERGIHGSFAVLMAHHRHRSARRCLHNQGVAFFPSSNPYYNAMSKIPWKKTAVPIKNEGLSAWYAGFYMLQWQFSLLQFSPKP